MAPRKDTRPYIKVTLDMPDHPKYAGLTRAQKFLVIEGWIHCAKYKTDGHMDIHVWRKFGTKKDRVLFEQVGIVKMDSDDAGANFVDYLEHQTSRAEQEAKQDQARSAGKKGGAAKAAKASETGSEPVAERYRPASVPLSGSLAEVEVEVRKEQSTYVDSSSHVSIAGEPEELPRGPAVPVDGWTIVRRIIPSEHSQATKTALSIEVASLLKQGTSEADVVAALHIWLGKSGIGPRVLPHLLSDVIRDRTAQPTSRGAPSKAETWLHLAHSLETESKAIEQ